MHGNNSLMDKPSKCNGNQLKVRNAGQFNQDQQVQDLSSNTSSSNYSRHDEQLEDGLNNEFTIRNSANNTTIDDDNSAMQVLPSSNKSSFDNSGHCERLEGLGGNGVSNDNSPQDDKCTDNNSVNKTATDNLNPQNQKSFPCKNCQRKDKYIQFLEDDNTSLQEKLKKAQEDLKRERRKINKNPKSNTKPQSLPTYWGRREPKGDTYIELASQNYEKPGYLLLMEQIVCDIFNINNRDELYTKKRVHKYTSSSCDTIPPAGSTVLYALVLSSDRFDDNEKKQRLNILIQAGVNVVICLFRTGNVYISRKNLTVGEDAIETLPFMVKLNEVNELDLSHNNRTETSETKRQLLIDYENSLSQLAKKLILPQQQGNNFLQYFKFNLLPQFRY